MNDERPNPDELLARVQAEEAKQAQGKLRIFFGMAPGVGKTYAMLSAARREAKDGKDVVVGYVEPHSRPETQALVLGLDVLPRRTVQHQNRVIYEFDLEAALARRPQIVLVDELAHTNAAGSTHAKRWQDVEDLLAAGIDVYTTLNVQHIESLNDVIAQVTSIPVRETVPDHVFDRADEVDLIDLSPDDLIDRLRGGKVYVAEQAIRAIENFFRKGNLIALRELALRKTAERVGEQAIDYRQQQDVTRIWPTSERFLVCVGPSPMSAKLLRAARRMASGMRAPVTALNVELENSPLASPSERERLEQNLRLAEELGAKVEVSSGPDFADAVLRFAAEHNITKIVVGKPQLSRWQEFWRGAFVYELIRKCGDIDVFVMSGDEYTEAPKARPKPPASSWLPYMWALAATIGCTLLCYFLSPVLATTNLAMFYLASVVAMALMFGRGPSILATVLGVASFDLLFVPPVGTFVVADTQYLVTFGVMLATGGIISELSVRIRAQTEMIRRRERRTAALYALSNELAGLPTSDAVAQAGRRIIRDALDVDVTITQRDASGGYIQIGQDGAPSQLVEDEGVIRWVYENRREAGHGTGTLPGTATTYIPLLVTGGIVGVLGVRPQRPSPIIEAERMRLLEAFASQVAGALERCELARHAEHVRMQIETERLRNSLLSAISHDLRTPLATVTGAASLLLDSHQDLRDEVKQDLIESILDEADQLHRLVTNLLDMTRLEEGAIRVHRELQPIEEVIGVVLDRMARRLRNHHVVTHIADDLPAVTIDGILIQQVFVNVLDNAIKFAPVNSTIDLNAHKVKDKLVVEIGDRGSGLPAGEEAKIFDKFYQASGTSRSGSGVGLAICRAIIKLHGGTIEAQNRTGGGALFRFTLPLENMGRPT